MRVFRVGLPFLTGIAVLVIAVLSVSSRLGEPQLGVVDAVRVALPMIAIAVLLLLVAVAIARRSRAGQVLGLGLAILAVLAGVGAIVVELPYLAEGGLSAALGGGVVILAGIWIVIWLLYGLAMLRGRGSFDAAWQPLDRRFGIVMAAVVLFTGAAYVALGAVVGDAAAAAAGDELDAAALVADTSVAIDVVSTTFGPNAGSGATVDRMTLDLTFSSLATYTLGQAPTICLTDAATAADPAFKASGFCWGTDGSPFVVSDGFGDLHMPAAGRHVRLALDGASSPCAFGAGPWQALVTIAPRGVASAGTLQAYAISAPFRVPLTAGATPGVPPVASSCIASTVSP